MDATNMNAFRPRRARAKQPSKHQSAVILFSQTYPFERGEEFLESELPHLAKVFDRVIVVPTLHAAGMMQTRELPEGATLVTTRTPRARQAAAVATFCLRHPLEAIRSLGRALSVGPRPREIWTDLKFDLLANAIAHGVAPNLAAALADIDEVVFYGFWLHTPARVALEARRLLGHDDNPAVSRANGYDLYVERHPGGFLPQRERLLSGLQQIFAASSSAEQYLRERYPSYRAKFTTDRIGTPEPINPGNASRREFHIVSCSYIAPVKRLTMLIDGLAQTQATTEIPIRWTHLGSGDVSYTREVMAYASEQLTPGSFQFLGYMANSELRKWYAENPASAFAQVSESEGGLAASIQEALAQGLPVLATAVGGVVALREDSDIFNGLLDKQHTPAEFAERLEHLLTSDDDVFARYVSASMAFWRAHCSADTLAGAFALRLREISTAAHQHSEAGTLSPRITRR